MHFRLLALLLVVFAIGFGLRSGPANAAPESGIPPTELQRIELLIQLVEQASDQTFIRNGTSYNAATAARFLRLKWDHNRDRVRTAEDFVREIGSQSGTSGSRYRVRNVDGSEEDSAAFLSRLLAGESRIAVK
ncbi:MAG TPA: DUF5329 family protein [Casimicrobiaceae bacterium]